jgi:hypothetical protein
VINDQVDGHQGVDLGWISSETLHGISHGSEIDNCRYTSEILEDDSSGSERDLDVVLRVFNPVEDLLNVSLFDAEVVAVTHCTLEENAD